MVIALFGLVLGWGSFISIGTYLYQELTYDRYHEKYDRIFRVTHNEKGGEIPGTRHLATVGPPLGPALKATFSQIEDVVRFRDCGNVIIRRGDVQHYETRGFYVDSSVFKIFSFSLIKGNSQTALSHPNQVVISQSMAKKYFGQEDPIGQVINMAPDYELKVTGVLGHVPANSHLQFDFLVPFDAFKVPHGYPVTLESWGWISFHTYVLLKPKQNARALENLLPGLVKSHWTEERAKKFKLQLQPLADIYFGDVRHDQVASGNKTDLYVLAGAGLLIMVVAIFNFANLFTVISISRAKEVGVRKVLGANKKTIAGHLSGEAVLLVISSLAVSIALLPLWSYFLPWQSTFRFVPAATLIVIIGVLLLIAGITGLLSGIYPSRLLISYDFQKLLKGAFKVGKAGLVIRRSMLFSQFVVSIALVICVLIIASQMKYLRTKELGYVKDELLLLRMPGEILAAKYPQLKTQLERNPNVMSVSVGGGRMEGETGNVPIYAAGATDEMGTPMAIDAVTFDFFKTIGINLIAGREFSLMSPADTLRGVIINESAAKEFHWSLEEAVGKKIRVGDIVLDGEVIGVVPDFNFGSLRVAIAPLVISYPRTRLQDVYVRFSSKDLNAVLSSVQADWKVILPDIPFDHVFLSSHLETLYKQDQLFEVMFQFFAAIAIFIACLGLYGLISQDIIYRIKEIGIRKVLGATTKEITILILKQFIVLIIIANILAWPLSYIFMQRWLNGFIYHTSIHWVVFPAAGIGTLVLALLSIASHSLKAAMTSPVDSIRKD